MKVISRPLNSLMHGHYNLEHREMFSSQAN
jgi:hypothetical protein